MCFYICVLFDIKNVVICPQCRSANFRYNCGYLMLKRWLFGGVLGKFSECSASFPECSNKFPGTFRVVICPPKCGFLGKWVFPP